MKFAKEIERDLVPEWREKYFDYKQGKKQVKAVAKAVHRAQANTPSQGRRTETAAQTPASGFFDLARTFSPKSKKSAQRPSGDGVDPAQSSSLRTSNGNRLTGAASGPEPTPHTPFARSTGSSVQYGSFAPKPSGSPHTDRGADFSLPGPAMKSPLRLQGPALQPTDQLRSSFEARLSLERSRSLHPVRSNTSGAVPNVAGSPRERLTRLFSGSPMTRRFSMRGDIGLQSLDQVRERELDFIKFMDGQLDKIETFYKAQEDKASQRLQLLRDQLHEMRNRRTEEVTEAKRRREQHPHRDDSSDENAKDFHPSDWINPIKSKLFKPGPNTQALQNMMPTPLMTGQPPDGRRDYVRRQHSGVPYRTAKRKLKLALQEFYRGLELLKSYALLNRTAFRKLNKKYDKAINAQPPSRYVNEKVNKAYFVHSDVVDSHLKTVEDLYARYFERGNHKLAAGKLRNLSKGPGDTSGSTFLNGLLIGVGGVFAVQGLVYGAELIFSPDPLLAQRSSYLLQVYGGYFLCWYLFTLFCLCARVWTINKINYHFIFEFDPRNLIDWRELSEFPSMFFMLLGVTLWLNFSQFGHWQAMFLYWPILLIGITVVILFLPAPVLYHRSRLWFMYSLSRLLAAGVYPVEFRDFFLGDMFCSLTYTMCNAALFICLYVHSWNDPPQCNSSHLWVMGLLSALPPFWRALQCLRRYHDTRNAFPHLANLGKYTFSILAAIFLSVYRINGTYTNLALFITFSTINAVYCSLWDILMDASLVSGSSQNFLLRDVRALKPTWPYYTFLVVDPVLRFAWIFYAIFTHDAQHSSVVSFLVAFAEVSRRGLWTVLRVENEHCANVRQYKASRDVPLPYTLEPFVEHLGFEASLRATATTSSDGGPPSGTTTGARATGVDGSPATQRVPGSVQLGPAQGTPGLSAEEGIPPEQVQATLRHRRIEDTAGRRSIRRVIAEAHKQDFEKKRQPPEELRQKDFEDEARGVHSDGDDDDDDDEEEDGDESPTSETDRLDMAATSELVYPRNAA